MTYRLRNYLSSQGPVSDLEASQQSELLAQPSALFIWNRVTRHLPHDCRMMPTEMAPKHKNDLSRLKR
jgi:hypothetical protein